MNILQSIILGLVQGLTEFLPVSSSGHLILSENLMHLNYETLKGFDIALHMGTLLAVIIYFWKDISGMLYAAWAGVFNRVRLEQDAEVKENFNLIGYLILGTIPAVIIGLLAGNMIDEYFRNPISVAILLAVVGALFFVVEKVAAGIKEKKEIGLREAIWIGIGQTLAFIPGVSRSGSTICSGLLVGTSREKAARFSFLLGGIAILAAGILAAYKIWKGEFLMPATPDLIAGVLSSMISGLMAIWFLMKYVKKHSLALFGWYRILAGVLLLLWLTVL